MKKLAPTVVLIQGTFAPVFAVVGEDGRPLRTFALPEKDWVLHHADLDGLRARVEAFEAQAGAELAQSGGDAPAEAETPNGS